MELAREHRLHLEQPHIRLPEMKDILSSVEQDMEQGKLEWGSLYRFGGQSDWLSKVDDIVTDDISPLASSRL